jgi:hypothetical protein
MSSTRKIFLDLDGVVVRCTIPIMEHHGIYISEYDYPANFLWDIQGATNMLREREGLPPLTASKFWGSLSYSFWRTLPTYRGALDFVRRLEQLGDVRLATSTTLDGQCAAGKVGWISEHLPDYQRKSFIGADKSVFAAIPGAILIDDRDKNCEDFRAAGGTAILVPRPWNKRGYSDVPYATVLADLNNILNFVESP